MSAGWWVFIVGCAAGVLAAVPMAYALGYEIGLRSGRRALGSCTGHLDPLGLLVHEGDTCPIHESEEVGA